MSVAIRAITQIQEADDAPTLGAGQDGYALTWDNASGAFVATALFTGGLLATGATTGATAQAQAFTVGISLTDTTTAATGVVFKGTDRFIHNFHHPTGQSAVPVGYNLFIGHSAGNFTTGSTATAVTHASYNIGIGFQSLQMITLGSYNSAFGANSLAANTTGNSNLAIGDTSLISNVDGSFNTAVGSSALRSNVSGSNNVAIGQAALNASIGTSNTAIGTQSMNGSTGNYNVAIGHLALQASGAGASNATIGTSSLYANTSGSYNAVVGDSALRENTTGSNNVAIGILAGRYHANGSTALTDPENSIYIGANVRGFNNSDANSIVIGYSAIGLGANTTVIGNTSTIAATIYGAGLFPLVSAATNTVSNVLTLTHDTSGTAAAGFGAGLLFQLESSTTAGQSAARIQALWNDPTHATRKADLVLTAYDTAEREGLRIRGAGSAPAIGFLGATPAARIAHVADPAGGATVDAEARSAINSILATLETFGLHATS